MHLIILNDPAGITGRRKLPIDFGISLQANIERHLSGGGDAELRINGQIVDPLTDPRLDLLPSRFDLVTVSLRPSTGWEIAYYAISALLLVSALTKSTPRVSDTSGKDSPNNKLTGQSNVARTYQAIPDVYGYRRVWPDLIQPSTIEYVAQVKFVTEWLCVSRGLGTISAVQYAETPIGDIDGSSYEVFEPVPIDGGYPEAGVTTLSDVYEPFESDEVNGQELPYAQAYPQVVKAGSFNAANGATTFTVTVTDGPDLDQLKSLVPSGTAVVDFLYGGGPSTFSETCTVLSYSVSLPNVTFTFSSTAWAAAASGSTSFEITPIGTTYTTVGPFTLPTTGGQIWWNTVFLRGLVGSVVIRAEWWGIDSTGAEIGGTRQTLDTTYTDGSYDQRFYTTKVVPTGGVGRYRIEFTRRSLKVDANSADVAKLEEVYTVRHHVTKTLPGVTVLRVTTKATLSAIGFSDRKFNLRWLRHVRTLNTDEIGESRNFARIMAHIWTIAGNDIAEIDTDALKAINQLLGEDSPLLRFDGSLDDADQSLGERLRIVAGNARCRVWRDGTRWTTTRDQRTSQVEIQFDYRNLAAGGESTISYAAHLPASNDGVEVEYVDETTQAKKAYVQLNISSGEPVPGVSINPKKVRMLGCTTAEQAENRAHLEARKLLYQRVSVSDTALSDAATLGLDALVRWVDPNDFGGDGLQAGEVLVIDGDEITTSEPLDWKGATSGRIIFTGQDGRTIGSPVLCYPVAGNDRKAQVALLRTEVYVADADRQLGSRYAFAVGLTVAEIESAGLYTVAELKPGGDGTVALSLASYDARIYEMD